MPTSWRVTRAGLASGPIRLKIVRRPIALRIGWMRAIAGWWFAANRKQMPRSASCASAIRPARAMSRPSASSVSAAPAFDEAARFPCFATGTSHAATTSDTAVETLSVWWPSPPVPQTSMAPSGASIGISRSRIACAAAAISTIVSPRSDSATRKAATSSSLPPPSSIVAKACAASSGASCPVGSGKGPKRLMPSGGREPAVRLCS